MRYRDAGTLATLATLTLWPAIARPQMGMPADPPDAHFQAAAGEVGIGVPAGLVVDAAGNLYIAAPELHRVLRRDPSGSLTVLAGHEKVMLGEMPEQPNEARPALRAVLDRPFGLALGENRYLYLTDPGKAALRRMDLTSGIITTIAVTGEPASQAEPPIAAPMAILLDPHGGAFVVDGGRPRVLKLDLSTGKVVPVAGDGLPGYRGDGAAALDARFDTPLGLALDSVGNLYVADAGNHVVRRVDGRTGRIETFAGSTSPGSLGDGGKARLATLSQPVAVLVKDEALYIADAGDGRVRKVDLKTGIIATLAKLERPMALAAGGAGVLVGDAARSEVVAIDAHGQIQALAGNGGLGFSGDGGPAAQARLRGPRGVAVDPRGGILVAEASGHRVRRIDPVTGLISTFAGNGRQGFDGDGGPAGHAALNQPSSLAVDAAGTVFIADRANRKIRRVGLDGKIATVFSAKTDRQLASEPPALHDPMDIVFARGSLFVSEGSGRVFRVDPTNGAAALVARKDDGTSPLPQLSALAVDADGNVFVGEQVERCVRRIDARTGEVTRVAGKVDRKGTTVLPSSVPLAVLQALAFGRSGELLIADTEGLYRLDLKADAITRLAGGGDRSVFRGGRNAASSLQLTLRGVAMEASGALILSVSGDRLLRLTPDGFAETISGGGFGF